MPDPTALGEMYELLDSYVCWVGSMGDEDARNLISRATRTAAAPPTETDVSIMLSLAGRFPALLRATCHTAMPTARLLTSAQKIVADETVVDEIMKKRNRFKLGETNQEERG